MTFIYLGHIVGERPPGLFSWLAAVVLFGGILAAVILRGRSRVLFLVVAVVGLGATIDDLIVRSLRPSRPNLVVRLVAPGRDAESPVLVKVCGQTKRGKPESPTANGRHLLVTVDHIQMAEVRQNTALIPLRRGRHLLRVEITNTWHQEFQPAIVFQHIVDVKGGGSTRIPQCSR